MKQKEEYLINTDSKGNPLAGSNCYKFQLPPDIPVCNFWSVLVYDTTTGLLIQTSQSWPSVHSQCRQLLVNIDGSIDIWFGPKVPTGKEHNWIQTIPEKKWYTMLNLYDLSETENKKAWKSGVIEEVPDINTYH